MRRLCFIFVFLLVIGGVFSIRTISHLYADKQRLEQNQHALLSDVELYRTAAGHSAASVEILNLEVEAHKLAWRQRSSLGCACLGRAADNQRAGRNRTYHPSFDAHIQSHKKASVGNRAGYRGRFFGQARAR